jgi:hypothetical protein
MKSKNIFLFCLLMIIIFLINYYILFINIHTSSEINLEKVDFNISPICNWYKSSFDFSDYHPYEFELISSFFEKLIKLWGIKIILRDGSFLHTFRQIKADMDMDVYMIIPNDMSFKEAYNIIEIEIEVFNAELKFEHQNILITGIFWEKSDAVRISYKGKKIVDINVLHETFINDPQLQNPCFEKMKCNMIDDEYINKNLKFIKTDNLFTNLCKCNYMNSELLCFNNNGEKYLEIRYGKDFRIPKAGGNNYDLIYERPKTFFRWILRKIPFLFDIKYLFEGHQNEEANHFNN